MRRNNRLQLSAAHTRFFFFLRKILIITVQIDKLWMKWKWKERKKKVVTKIMKSAVIFFVFIYVRHGLLFKQYGKQFFFFWLIFFVVSLSKFIFILWLNVCMHIGLEYNDAYIRHLKMMWNSIIIMRTMQKGNGYPIFIYINSYITAHIFLLYIHMKYKYFNKIQVIYKMRAYIKTHHIIIINSERTNKRIMCNMEGNGKHTAKWQMFLNNF